MIVDDDDFPAEPDKRQIDGEDAMVFATFGWQWLTPIIGIMLVAASLGGMLTWLAGPSKGLLLISRREDETSIFTEQNRQFVSDVAHSVANSLTKSLDEGGRLRHDGPP